MNNVEGKGSLTLSGHLDIKSMNDVAFSISKLSVSCRSLALSGCQLDGSCLPSFYQLLVLPLQHLDLSQNDLDSAAAMRLSVLLSSQHGCGHGLVDLNISGNIIFDMGLNAILTACPRLEILQIQACGITAKAELFGAFPKGLRILNVSYNTISDEGAKLLAELIKSKVGLQQLSMAHCGVTPIGLAAMSASIGDPASQLQRLDIAGNTVNEPSSLNALADALSASPSTTSPCLTHLRLGELLCAPCAVLRLARACSQHPSLLVVTLVAPIELHLFRTEARVSFAGQRFGDIEAVFIAVLLLVSSDVERLDVSENCFSGDAFAVIASAAKVTGTSLQISKFDQSFLSLSALMANADLLICSESIVRRGLRCGLHLLAGGLLLPIQLIFVFPALLRYWLCWDYHLIDQCWNENRVYEVFPTTYCACCISGMLCSVLFGVPIWGTFLVGASGSVDWGWVTSDARLCFWLGQVALCMGVVAMRVWVWSKHPTYIPVVLPSDVAHPRTPANLFAAACLILEVLQWVALALWPSALQRFGLESVAYGARIFLLDFRAEALGGVSAARTLALAAALAWLWGVCTVFLSEAFLLGWAFRLNVIPAYPQILQLLSSTCVALVVYQLLLGLTCASEPHDYIDPRNSTLSPRWTGCWASVGMNNTSLPGDASAPPLWLLLLCLPFYVISCSAFRVWTGKYTGSLEIAFEAPYCAFEEFVRFVVVCLAVMWGEYRADDIGASNLLNAGLARTIAAILQTTLFSLLLCYSCVALEPVCAQRMVLVGKRIGLFICVASSLVTTVCSALEIN
jgi:hypothetical protein